VEGNFRKWLFWWEFLFAVTITVFVGVIYLFTGSFMLVYLVRFGSWFR
jgi:hypothetical protein